jgi:hypothetical protein
MDYDDTIYDELLDAIEGADSPEKVVDVFTRLVNAVIGPQVIDGERRPLRPDDVEHAMTYGDETLHIGGNMFGPNIGALFRGGKTYVGLLVNYRWWDTASKEARLVFLLHEISHLEQQNRLDEGGHGPAFWEINLGLYKEAKRQYALVEALFGSPFDWDRADWYFITMPTLLNIEHEHEAVPERQQAFADALGYGEEFDAFELLTPNIKPVEYDWTETVKLSEIHTEHVSDTELNAALSEWVNRPQSQLWVDRDTLTYRVEPPAVTHSGEGYTVVVGERRLALLKRTLGAYTDDPTIPVKLMDENCPI